MKNIFSGEVPQEESSMVTLSTFAKNYNLTEEQVIRMYIFFTGNEVSRRPHRLSKKDVLIEKTKAERFLISAFEFKRCSHCGKILPYSEFWADASKWNNRCSWCNSCQSESQRERNQQKRDAKLDAKAIAELDALLQKYPSLKDMLKSA